MQQLNGWKLEEFQATVDAVKDRPETGRLTMRNHLVWTGGFSGDAHIDQIEQLDGVMQRRFTLRADHPPELLGENTGPTAAETMLASLAECVAGTYAAQATARGVRLDELEVTVEGEIDLNGFLQLSPTRAGLQDVRVGIRVKSDADEQTLQEIEQATHRASPVYDSIQNPVSIRSSVEKLR